MLLVSHGKGGQSFLSLLGENVSADRKYLFLNIAGLGLANRLRTLHDWYQIAKNTNRTLLVNWVPSVDCNASFSELFSSWPTGIIIEYFFASNRLVDISEAVCDAFISDKRSCTIWRLKDHTSESVGCLNVLGDYFWSETFIIVAAHDGVIAVEGTHCATYFATSSNFYLSLIPHVETRNYLELVGKYFENKIMIGVHYRVHNSSFDWNVVPALDGGAPLGFGHISSLSFIEIMKEIEKHFSYSLPDGSVVITCRFFIASNNIEAKNVFLDHFPSSIFLDGNTDRSDVEGIRFALLEWLLLAESRLLINTMGSSFAVEASRVHLRPLVSLWGQHYRVHHSSIQLPGCGHFHFAYCRNSTNLQLTRTEGGEVKVRSSIICSDLQQ
jgi:hypothetical protein